MAQVGADAGGVVELAGRARLTIPPGALTADAEVRLTAVGAAPSAIAFPLEQPVAPAVNVEIRGAELTEPATLEFLFDPDVVDLPDDPIIATSSQWVDIGWLLLDSSIDPDGGVVTTTSMTPNGWWRPSVWDWSRLPTVVDRAVAGLDDATVPEPGCTTRGAGVGAAGRARPGHGRSRPRLCRWLRSAARRAHDQPPAVLAGGRIVAVAGVGLDQHQRPACTSG